MIPIAANYTCSRNFGIPMTRYVSISIPSELIPQVFSKWLAFYRKLYSLSQRDLADKLGISLQTVSNWETGRTTATLEPETVKELCALFRVKPKQIPGGVRILQSR